MGVKSASARSKFDGVKWVFAVLLLALLVLGNAYYSQIALPIRVTIMIVVGIVALLLMLSTQKGRGVWQFGIEARAELRKVIWPTRQETVQTTLMIAALVIIAAIILWAVDSLFAYVISSIIV